MSAVFFIVSRVFFKLGDVQCTMFLIQIMLILYHFTSPYDESERSLYHLVDRNMNSTTGSHGGINNILKNLL